VQRDQFKVLDMWDVTAMRGSGSNDVVVEDEFIPAELVFSLGGHLESTDRSTAVSSRHWCFLGTPRLSSALHNGPSTRWRTWPKVSP